MRRNSIACLFLASSVLLCTGWCGILYGNDALLSGSGILIEKHRHIEDKLEKSPFGIPVYLESSVDTNASHVDIYGIVPHPFAVLQKEMEVPANWCDIVLPHIDVRACTYAKVNDAWLLNTYSVTKASESFEDSYQMKLQYRVSEAQPVYFNISLFAQEGPFNTKEHQFKVEAVPLDKENTFIHVRHSFSYSSLEYYLMKMFGGSQVGFSRTGTDSEGKPIYTDGLRGEVERNVVCYYLAILAYLDTLKIPAGQRFERRISQWYDLTDQYKRQLFEITKEKYLAYKRQADKVSKRLQSDLDR